MLPKTTSPAFTGLLKLHLCGLARLSEYGIVIHGLMGSTTLCERVNSATALTPHGVKNDARTFVHILFT